MCLGTQRATRQLKVNVKTNVNPRPLSVFRHFHQWGEGGGACARPRVMRLSVVELSEKIQHIALDEYLLAMGSGFSYVGTRSIVKDHFLDFSTLLIHFPRTINRSKMKHSLAYSLFDFKQNALFPHIDRIFVACSMSGRDQRLPRQKNPPMANSVNDRLT